MNKLLNESLFETGLRPVVDKYFENKSKEARDYGEYWSASSAGYCMRRQIFQRLGVDEIVWDKTVDARKQRIFSMGHIVHTWIQEVTREAGISVAQEYELIDHVLFIIGHFDDLISIDGKLIMYDYKSVNSRAFTWAKKNNNAMSYYHHMQLGTYLYMARKVGYSVDEGRILKISKDDLRMDEQQLLWTDKLLHEVLDYWVALNTAWDKYKATGEIPPCTCGDHENGFLAKAPYNPYFYQDEPCSEKYFRKWEKENQE